MTRLGVLATGLVLGAALSLLAVAAVRQVQTRDADEGWLTGTTEEKLAQVERHLRGLDVAMAEIGYRYGELLTAGRTRNWEYARYQTEKIGHSLRLAVERRPKRAESAAPFLEESLPAVLSAVAARTGETMDRALAGLRAGCIQCHAAESVPHFQEVVDRIHERIR